MGLFLLLAVNIVEFRPSARAARGLGIRASLTLSPIKEKSRGLARNRLLLVARRAASPRAARPKRLRLAPRKRIRHAIPAARPSTPRNRRSSVASRSSAPGRIARARQSSVSRETRRRFLWRSFGQGSGNRMKTRPSVRGGQAIEQQQRVIGEDPDIAEALAFDFRQELGDAVLEHLGADEADPGMGGALRRQMLAGAEADLEPDFPRGRRKQFSRIERTARRKRRCAAAAASCPSGRGVPPAACGRGGGHRGGVSHPATRRRRWLWLSWRGWDRRGAAPSSRFNLARASRNGEAQFLE